PEQGGHDHQPGQAAGVADAHVKRADKDRLDGRDHERGERAPAAEVQGGQPDRDAGQGQQGRADEHGGARGDGGRAPGPAALAAPGSPTRYSNGNRNSQMTSTKFQYRPSISTGQCSAPSKPPRQASTSMMQAMATPPVRCTACRPVIA